MKHVELPDYRNVPRGCEWLRRIIEDVRSMDDAVKLCQKMASKEAAPQRPRDREPGEEG